MTFLRCMKAAFYRPDYQKFLMCPLIKDSVEHLLQKMGPSLWNSQLSFWNTHPSFWNTRPSFWGFKRKLKARPRVWKAQPHVWKVRLCLCVLTRPMLSQSATVHLWLQNDTRQICSIFLWINIETYSQSCQTSKKAPLAKIVNG